MSEGSPEASPAGEAEAPPAPEPKCAGETDGSEFPLPGPGYAVARWKELSDHSSAWWTRPCEVGLRLRLAELVDLAELNALGVVQRDQLESRRQTTVAQLREPDIKNRFPALEKSIEALERSSYRAFTPMARGPAAAADIKEALSATGPGLGPYLEMRVDTVATAMEQSTWDLDALRDLDQAITMLDAEIAHLGHSPAWRHRAATALQDRLVDGAEAKEALTEALTTMRFNQTRAFDVLIPIEGETDLPDARGLTSMPVAEGVLIANTWPATGRGEALEAIGDAARVLRIKEPVESVDLEAAAAHVSEQVRRATNLWALQGYPVSQLQTAYITDPVESRVSAVDLPQDPLDLTPDGLNSYTPKNDATILDDALDQLAEARFAAAPAALVNLWTVVETLYGGVLNDSPHLAGGVLAGVGEYCFVNDALQWLADASAAAGIGEPTPDDTINWVISEMVKDPREFGGKLQASDPLTWARWKALTGWNHGLLVGELGRLQSRFGEVTDRAYLIRNFAVHQARTKDRALSRILPAFAGLVQAAVGHTLRQGCTDAEILSNAMSAKTKAQTLADDLANKRTSTPGAEQPFLR